MAKKKAGLRLSVFGKDDAAKFPRKVSFDGAVVMVDKRSNGSFSLRWREGGIWKKTTRADEGKAIEWAERKAREIAGKAGMQWIRPGDAEALEGLRRVAVSGGVPLADLIMEVKGAVDLLSAAGGVSRLREAAAYFVSSGPGGVVDVTLYEALKAVRGEYDDVPRSATRSTMRTALDGMKRMMTDKRLAEVSREDVEGFVFEKGKSVRTVRNRLSQAVTFFARCRVLGYWPQSRPLPTVAIKKPRLADTAPEIFLPSQGKRLLAKVRSECPRYLPYLIIAGWCGCRPTECLRVRWEAFDFENSILHLSHEVVGKTGRERWVPLREEVTAALLGARATMEWSPADRVCLTHSREELSKLARSMGMDWPADVLRHSAITYTLQVLGNDYNKTAEIMGNSPKVIESNYRRPIPAGYGEAWMKLLES